MSTPDPMPSAEIVFDTLFAYQKSAALKTAIDLELFTAIDDGAHTAAAIASRTNVSERGARILCDYLTVNRLLAKSDSTYQLVPLRKVHAALRPGGRVAVLEFMPNPDRVSPPMPARFSLTMLAETAGGDAFTFAELRGQLEDAGFHDVEAHGLPTPQTLLIART
jgi:hypothetical protein